MSTATRDFASAGASAAMREKRLSKGGLHLVKTVSRASEAARDRDYSSVTVTKAPTVRKASIVREQPPRELSPEQKAFETVNYVLRTLGNRLGSAGLVSLPSLDRALTSATAAVLFSAEASPLFESLRNQAHDLVLVNSVFCAIYFVGFVTERLAATLPHYKATYTPLGMKVIEQLMHASIGEEATKDNYDENQKAYAILRTATGLLKPTNSGPGIFPGFPVLKASAFSPTGFLTAREHKGLVEKLVTHLTKNGFPQPSKETTEAEPGRGREKPAPEVIQIKDWKFLTSDANSKTYEVAHSDKHIGENFGRVLYWLICSAHRMAPGQAVVVYHQQHIQLVRWLGDRFGFKVLSMASDLDWSGKHFDVSPKLKAMIREWLVIVPAPPSSKKKRRSRNMTDRQMANAEFFDSQRQDLITRQRTNDSQDTQYTQLSSPRKANTKETRRPVRHGRSVSFADDKPPELDRQSRTSDMSGSSGMQSLTRVRTGDQPLRSAIKAARAQKNDSPPRPIRPAEEDIPDMSEVDKRTGEVPRPPSSLVGDNSAARPERRSFMPEDGALATADRSSKRSSFAGSPKPLSPGAGLPPFVRDMTNSRGSSDSKRSSRSESNVDLGLHSKNSIDLIEASLEQPAETIETFDAREELVESEPQTAPLAMQRTNTVSSNGDISTLPGAMYVLQKDDFTAPPVPAKSPRRMSPVSTPPPDDTPSAAQPTSYYDAQTLPSLDTTTVTASATPTGATMSPVRAADWKNDGQAEFTGISEALVHSRRGSNEYAPATQAPAFVSQEQTHHDDTHTTTPKAQTSFLPPSHRLSDSNISSVSNAPSWPSSIASIPSSVPDTPTDHTYTAVSTAPTSTETSLLLSNSARRKAPPPPAKPLAAVALYDFESEDPEEELPFKQGDHLEVIEQNEELEEDGWCKARLNGNVGLVPLAYIEFAAGDERTVVSDDSVSLWSGFNQVIGWTRFANLNHEDQASTSTTRQLDAVLDWNDVDADEFASRSSQASPSKSQLGSSVRSPSVHTLRADTRRPQFADPFALSPSLDASPIPSRALSEYESSNPSVAGSAAPDPLFSIPKMTSHAASRDDDFDATPRPQWPSGREDDDGIPPDARDYFERAESISGATEISETDSRIASFEVAPRLILNNPNAIDTDTNTESATTVAVSDLTPAAPRFWDDVSGGISTIASSSSRGTPAPSSVGIPGSVRSDPGPGAPGPVSRSRHQAVPRFWDDVSGGVAAPASTSIGAARSDRGPPSDAGSQKTAVPDGEAPRFWDDVSGGVAPPAEGASCRQS